jgi:hypothetical protein
MSTKQAAKFYRLAGPIVAEIGASLELNMPSADTTMRF